MTSPFLSFGPTTSITSFHCATTLIRSSYTTFGTHVPRIVFHALSLKHPSPTAGNLMFVLASIVVTCPSYLQAASLVPVGTSSGSHSIPQTHLLRLLLLLHSSTGRTGIQRNLILHSWHHPTLRLNHVFTVWAKIRNMGSTSYRCR